MLLTLNTVSCVASVQEGEINAIANAHPEAPMPESLLTVMGNPFKESEMKADPVMDREGPVYKETLAQMEKLP